MLQYIVAAELVFSATCCLTECLHRQLLWRTCKVTAAQPVLAMAIYAMYAIGVG